jgi:hypothetical protein
VAPEPPHAPEAPEPEPEAEPEQVPEQVPEPAKTTRPRRRGGPPTAVLMDRLASVGEGVASVS